MEVESKDSESKASETEKEATFKKPVLLVGKLGRCPRKLSPTKKTTYQTSEDKHPTENVAPLPDEAKEDNKLPSTVEEDDKSSKKDVSYKEPEWGGIPATVNKNYTLEVLKSGSIIEVVDLMSKSYWIFGRAKNADVIMQHPTVSRYHAVLQYRMRAIDSEGPGFYLYDMESTHGTFLNKIRLRPRSYVRVKVGHMFRFGGSTRNFIFSGPEEDAEKESEFTVTELRENKLKKVLEATQKKEEKEDQGIDWGMGDDADEETDLTENPYAQTNNEELYIEDPKKALRGFMEREGVEYEYICTEQRMGEFLCKVMLPLDDQLGRPIFAEVVHKGKKKEAVVQCALEACKILDRHGVLRQATHESRKRKNKDWEANDYYDSDEDTFLDRTGTIERKRANRMKAKNPEKQVETYHSLSERESELKKKINEIEKQLQKNKNDNNEASTTNEEDSLDSYMKSLKEPQLEKQTISRLKSELITLKQDYAQVTKLLNLAKPAELPALLVESSTSSKLLPVFGKKKMIKVEKPPKSTEFVKNDGNEEEMEEENEDVHEKGTESKVDEKKEKAIISNIDVTSKKKEDVKSEVPIKTTDENKMETKTKEVSSTSSTPKKTQNEQKEKKHYENKKKNTLKDYPKEGFSDDYNMWVPPTDQTGDGRTSLNDKLGY